MLFGTQEAACQSCANTAHPKSADIKHLGAATVVCVHRCVSVSCVNRRCLGFIIQQSDNEGVQYVAEIRAGSAFRSESPEGQSGAKKVKSLS